MSVTIFTMMVGADGFSAAALAKPIGTIIATDLALKFDLATQGLFLAQQFQSVDLMANLQNGWADFLQTGKAGALAVGLVMGYTIRGITR
jgi:hypothetical protein